MIIPESIDYLHETGVQTNQEDYIWPVAGKATLQDKVFIVCDGDGSFYQGGIASRIVGRYMAAKVLKLGEKKISGEGIGQLLTEARGRLIQYARENRLDTDLSTSFSMLVLYNQKVFISWCGDSRIYHLRRGEILFKTDNDPPDGEPIQNTTITRGITADRTPIHAETKWIEDVQAGDYFLLCTKGFERTVADDDIKSVVSQNDEARVDLAESFRRVALEKTADNFSMYLIKLKEGTKRRITQSGIIAIYVLPFAVIAILITNTYFRKRRTQNAAPPTGNQMVTPPPKPVPPATDSVKSNIQNPPAAVQKDTSAGIPIEEKPVQANQVLIGQHEPVAQLLLKFTTDEACKLKITNTDLDQVINWDLAQNDNGTLYLKPGKYSITATSVNDSTKSKTYQFDVKPGSANSSKNLDIRF
jgi:protein phosphatase